MWYDNISLRGTKELKTKGELYAKLFNNFKKARPDTDTRSMVIKVVAKAVGLVDTRLQAFMTGLFEDIPNNTFNLLLEYIKMDADSFKKFAKNTAIPSLGMFSKDFMAPKADKPAPAIAPPKEKSEEAAKNIDTRTEKAIKLSIENYVEEPFILTYDSKTGTLEIHPNYAENKLPKDKKVILLHNAVVFAGKTVPGKASL